MALDALEKDRLRRTMATRMGVFLEGSTQASCVSGHHCDEVAFCELCQNKHAEELLVIKNRGGRKMMKVAEPCLREMVRFKVVEVDDLARWLEKLKGLRAEAAVRRAEQAKLHEEERKRLEKRVIVRRRVEPTAG
jgi:hypothetical protein